MGWLVAGMVAVLVREVTRSPGSQQWPVQECLAPLQPPVLHSLLLEAGSDKATHHGYTSACHHTVYTPCTVQVQQILRAAAGAPHPGPAQAAGDRGGGRPQPRRMETILPQGEF